jgi:mRNA interferase YafQ
VLTPVWSGRFKRDGRRAQKRGKDMDKLKVALSLLIKQNPRPASYNDHTLKGDWRGFRDLHGEPDWLLPYPFEGDALRLPALVHRTTFSINDWQC